MARALGLMYLAGPTVAVITILLPHSSEVDDTGVLVVAAIAYGCSPLVMLFPRVTPAFISVMVGVASVLVTLVVWFGGETAAVYSFFYLWATPLAFVFFSLRHALLHLLFAGALYAGVLAAISEESGGEAGRWVMTMSTVAVVGLVVRGITQALREESERLERERRQRAMEINDNIVQGLVLAKGFGERGLDEQRDKAVADSLAKAQGMIGDLLGDDPVEDGSLRREAPAEPS